VLVFYLQSKFLFLRFADELVTAKKNIIRLIAIKLFTDNFFCSVALLMLAYRNFTLSMHN